VVPDSRGWLPVPAPRALAELSVDAALASASELAVAWTLALIRSRALDDVERLPLGALARDAPGLIAQLIAAVHSDAELERLVGAAAPERSPSAAGRLSELAGAGEGPAGAVRGLELLRAIVSESLEGGLRDATPRQTADLCQRVAHVCSRVLVAGLDAPQEPPAAHSAHLPFREDQPSPPGRREDAAATRDRVLIVDELEGVGDAEVTARAAPDTRPQGTREQGEAGGAPIEIRDQRAEPGAVAWIAAIARQLERYEADRLPFAVLLVELRDIERLRLETPPAELAAIGASLEQTLLAKLPRAGSPPGAAGDATPPWTGSLTAQRPGRCWLIVPETDRLAAHALADRLSRAAATLSHRGKPLEVLAGVAVCPQDGRQAAALAAHADIDLHAARSSRR
jgi:hypothetical protein